MKKATPEAAELETRHLPPGVFPRVDFKEGHDDPRIKAIIAHNEEIARSRSRKVGIIRQDWDGPLAVVGGSPSVLLQKDILRRWEGPVWCCGSAWQWCNEFVGRSQHPVYVNLGWHPDHAKEVSGARHAIIATCSDPRLFIALDANGALIETYVRPSGNYATTTATVTPWLARKKGLEVVSFFGCDSSFDRDRGTHAYPESSARGKMTLLRVEANGGTYWTNADFFVQATWLARAIYTMPGYRCRSGGLLAALVASRGEHVISDAIEPK